MIIGVGSQEQVIGIAAGPIVASVAYQLALGNLALGELVGDPMAALAAAIEDDAAIAGSSTGKA